MSETTKNQLAFHRPFTDAWGELPARAKRMLKEFAKYPTSGNQSYAIGYLAALYDNSVVSCDTYHYLLSLCGQLPSQGFIIEAIKESE